MTERAKNAAIETAEKCVGLIYKHKNALLFGSFVFLFGLVPVNGLYPFGFAVYIAGDKHHGAGFWCLLCSILICNAPILCLPVAIGIYAFKKITEGHCSNPGIKPLAALTVAAFLWATKTGESFYSLASSAMVLAILPLFTVLYSFCAHDSGYKPIMRHGGLAALMFTFLLLLSHLFGHILFPIIPALFITLAASQGGGMLYGGLYGFVCGLSVGSGGAAMCAITGLIAGLFSVSNMGAAVLCGAFAGLCTGFYFFGIDSALWLFAAFIFTASAYGAFSKKISLLPFGKIAIKGVNGESCRTPFAEAFFAISQNARKAAVSETEAARTADPYACISNMLNIAADNKETEAHFDSRLSSHAATLLLGAGVRAQSVSVTGGRRKRLVAEGVELDRLSLSASQLKALMSKALGVPMKEPQFFPVGGKARLVMESAPAFRIECSRTGCPKKGEEVCGDTVSFFSGEGGYFYALISDGMGSGKVAASCSRLTSVFLEKLLEAGADRRSALSLLNNFLASRDEEVFATVDLFEADLYTGKGVMIKAGAAPSFILRDGKCRALHSATSPAGIIREINAEQLSFDIKDGDTLIMISDGIAESPDNDNAIGAIACAGKGISTAALADKLLMESVKRTGRRDDMSVCVIKIYAA